MSRELKQLLGYLKSDKFYDGSVDKFEFEKVKDVEDFMNKIQDEYYDLAEKCFEEWFDKRLVTNTTIIHFAYRFSDFFDKWWDPSKVDVYDELVETLLINCYDYIDKWLDTIINKIDNIRNPFLKSLLYIFQEKINKQQQT